MLSLRIGHLVVFHGGENRFKAADVGGVRRERGRSHGTARDTGGADPAGVWVQPLGVSS